MQHATIPIAPPLAHAITFPGGKMTAADRRAFALDAHQAATDAPDRADWRAVADMLAAVLPRTKGNRDASLGEAPAPETPWVHYAITNSKRIVWPSPVLIVRFADGIEVRVSAPSLGGKPINWGRAVHRSIFVYRWHVAHCVGETSRSDLDFVAVPEILTIRSEAGSDTWPASAANAETAELRAGSFDLWAELAAADGRDGWRDMVRERFRELQPSRAQERADRAQAIAAYEALIARPPAAPESEPTTPVVVSFAAARARRLLAGSSLGSSLG